MVIKLYFLEERTDSARGSLQEFICLYVWVHLIQTPRKPPLSLSFPVASFDILSHPIPPWNFQSLPNNNPTLPPKRLHLPIVAYNTPRTPPPPNKAGVKSISPTDPLHPSRSRHRSHPVRRRRLVHLRECLHYNFSTLDKPKFGIYCHGNWHQIEAALFTLVEEVEG